MILKQELIFTPKYQNSARCKPSVTLVGEGTLRFNWVFWPRIALSWDPTLCLDLKSFNRKRLITFSLIHSNLLLKTVLLLTLFPSFCLPLSKRNNDTTTVATSSNLVAADKRRQLENPVSQNTTWRLYKFKVLFHVQLDSIMQGSEKLTHVLLWCSWPMIDNQSAIPQSQLQWESLIQLKSVSRRFSKDT